MSELPVCEIVLDREARAGRVLRAGAANVAHQASIGCRPKYFGDARPRSATIIVKALIRPEQLIEIEAVAAAKAGSHVG